MATRYLLRHCQYANPLNLIVGRLPVELSPDGMAEAARLKHYFSDKNIGHIYSSAVRRCKQTAEAVANDSIAVTFDKRLLEGFSAYQGFWINQERPPWHDFYSHRDELGGESIGDIQSRMVDFWQSLSAEKNNCVICSHGDPLYALYSYLTDLPLSATSEAISQRQDYIPKAAFWRFEGEGETWKLVDLVTQDKL